MDVGEPDVGKVGLHLGCGIEHEGEQTALAYALVPQRLCEAGERVGVVGSEFGGIVLQAWQFDAEVDAIVGGHAGLAHGCGCHAVHHGAEVLFDGVNH